MGCAKLPRGSDRLLTFINNEERTHTHANTPFPPLHKTSSFSLLSSTSPFLLVPLILRGALVFCMMSSWGASLFGRRLCLTYEMKKKRKKKERQREKKKTEKEAENLRPLGALLPTL